VEIRNINMSFHNQEEMGTCNIFAESKYFD